MFECFRISQEKKGAMNVIVCFMDINYDENNI